MHLASWKFINRKPGIPHSHLADLLDLPASPTKPSKGKFSRMETGSIGRFLEEVYINQENLRCSLWLQGKETYQRWFRCRLQKYATNLRQWMDRPKEEVVVKREYLRLGQVRMVWTHPAVQLRWHPLFALPSPHCCGFVSWHHSGHSICFHCSHTYITLATW